jgi:hypothetical protein
MPGQTSSGLADAFIRKYDPNGNELWTRQFGSSANDYANAVTADATGVYVAGQTWGTLPGQTTSGLADVFIRKYDPSGNELWTRQFGSSNLDYGNGVAADGTAVYVAGRTYGTLAGQTADWGAFIRKYDLGGNELWTRQFGDSPFDSAIGVAAGATGVYVAGNMQTGSDTNLFIRKYDPSGNLLWVSMFGTARLDYAGGVAADGTGAYVTGYTFGAFPGQLNAGNYDVYIRKYDPNGNELWTREFGTAESDYGFGVTSQQSGLYLAGGLSSPQNAFVARFR